MAIERAERTPLQAARRLLTSREAVLVLGALAVAFCLFSAFDAIRIRPSDGTVWLLGRPELTVLDVPPGQSPNPSPLRAGDRIVGIAHKLVRGPQEAAHLLRQQEIGSTVLYLVERDGEWLRLHVPLSPFRAVDRGYAGNLVLAVAYLVISFWIFIKSRNDQPARLFFLLCLAFATFFVTIQSRSSYFWGDLLTQNGGALARFFLPAFFLHFFLVFPEKKLVLTRHHFLQPLLYLLPASFYISFTFDQFFGAHGASIGLTDWLVLGLYFCAGLIALLHGYYSYHDPLQKQRVRILTLGTLSGVVPFLLFRVGMGAFTENENLLVLGMLPLLAIPVSFGYCIARYRVMQIELLVRRSLLYSFVSGAVLLLYLGLVVGLGALALQLTSPTSQLVSVGATLAIAALLWPLRARLQAGIDRRFFRARDELGTVLQEFSREIPRLIQRDALLERVGQRLCEVLDLSTLGIYLRGGRGQETTWVLGRQMSCQRDPARLPVGTAPPPLPPVLPLQATARQLLDRREPFLIEAARRQGRDGRRAISREQAELAERLSEQQTLVRSGISLLVPLIAQDRLIGMFALPPKPGGESYRLHELELLGLVAGQVALQVENSRLYEEEVAKRKLEEEMALARSIQSRLLPSQIPSIAGVELEAVNLSSRLVSGDYYDFIQREDGCLGIVISDVSGKGMPASLLASSLQAALRAQCDTGASPGRVLERVNRQLHASTDPQHFATLFLAVYEPASRSLRYSSGGHNPPILLRADGRAELLDKGGLPLGAFDFGSYEEGLVTLDPGDLLFLYTDGLTETVNDRDEEFGTERLEDLLRDNRQLPANLLVDRLQQAVHEFSGRDEADDDITMIALRMAARAAVDARGGIA
jgi:sigma-B regulation protein RsbU (phosphoserine phosphatase)